MSTDERLRRLERSQSQRPREMHELSDKELCAIIMEGTDITDPEELTDDVLQNLIAEDGRERGR
jgi:hypothetical protein